MKKEVGEDQEKKHHGQSDIMTQLPAATHLRPGIYLL